MSSYSPAVGRTVYIVAVYATVVVLVAWFGGWGPAFGVALFGGIWTVYAIRHPRKRPDGIQQG
jgi:hypothetical protein